MLDTVTINDSLSASAAGFRGGGLDGDTSLNSVAYRSASTADGAEKGEAVADKNLDLFQRRAAHVRRHLLEKERIDADRLESVGCGETRPVASNATAKVQVRGR